MSGRSFSLVDTKVAEAEFFLTQISTCGFNFFAVQCYVNAFASSARSITYSLQAVMKPIDGFEAWYVVKQEELKKDTLARFFHELRRVNQHIGEYAVRDGTTGPNMPTRYWFRPTEELPTVPKIDVETACKKYFVMILQIIYDCYIEFGPHIDPKQHYTAEHYETLGKSLEDLEIELFGPLSIGAKGISEDHRWQLIRDQMGGCEINGLFAKYLDKVTPEPERL